VAEERRRWRRGDHSGGERWWWSRGGVGGGACGSGDNGLMLGFGVLGGFVVDGLEEVGWGRWGIDSGEAGRQGGGGAASVVGGGWCRRGGDG
jgi:hypothetical protein